MMLTINPECTNDLHGNKAPAPESLQSDSRDHARLLNTVLILFIIAVAAYIFIAPMFG